MHARAYSTQWPRVRSPLVIFYDCFIIGISIPRQCSWHCCYTLARQDTEIIMILLEMEDQKRMPLMLDHASHIILTVLYIMVFRGWVSFRWNFSFLVSSALSLNHLELLKWFLLFSSFCFLLELLAWSAEVAVGRSLFSTLMNRSRMLKASRKERRLYIDIPHFSFLRFRISFARSTSWGGKKVA